MKDNLEEKAKYFALNVGDFCLIHTETPHLLTDEVRDRFLCQRDGGGYPYKLHGLTPKGIKNYSILKIPFKNISEEDAVRCVRIGYEGYLNVKIIIRGEMGFNFEFEYDTSSRRRSESFSLRNPTIAQLDFLRRKGYAIPYSSFSVEDLVSFGWAILI